MRSSTARTSATSSACGHIACSSRGGPGQHDDRHRARGHDQARRGADRVQRGRALGHHRLLAVGLPQRLGVDPEAAREPAQDLGDLRLHLLVEDQLAAGEAGDDLGREVVGGRPQAAGGDDQVQPLRGAEAQRRLEVLGAVADEEDVGDLDAQLREALGDPGPVAVGDPTGQHLGPGDDDAGPHRFRRAVAAHGHFSWLASALGVRSPRGVISQVSGSPSVALTLCSSPLIVSFSSPTTRPV